MAASVRAAEDWCEPFSGPELYLSLRRCVSWLPLFLDYQHANCKRHEGTLFRTMLIDADKANRSVKYIDHKVSWVWESPKNYLHTKMLSLALSQKLLLFEPALNESPLHIHRPPYILTQPDLAKSKTKSKIDVSCVNCDFKESRNWQGWIIGKGITGFLSAFLIRNKHMNKLLKRNTLLRRLLTIYNNCYFKLD